MVILSQVTETDFDQGGVLLKKIKLNIIKNIKNWVRSGGISI